MKRIALLTVLAGIFLVGIGGGLMGPGDSSVTTQAWWIGFLLLMPVGLAILVGVRLHWAAMACVIYGTIGLALDLATLVQILTKDVDVLVPVIRSVVSGLLNFLLIVFGGRSFLDATPAPSPLGSRPPSPPSPS